jgi:hypothetical protein
MSNRIKKAVLEVLKNNPEFREDFKNELKINASSWIPVRTADLPKYLIQVLKTLGFRKRMVSVKVTNTYSIYSPAGDGERGIFTLVDLSSKSTSPLLRGDWGGGGPGSPKAVDTDQSQKPLKDFQVAVSGYQGGHGTWVVLSMTQQTFDMIQSKGIKASATIKPGDKFEDAHGVWVVSGKAKGSTDMWEIYLEKRGKQHSKVEDSASLKEYYTSKKAASKNPGPKGLRKEFYELSDAIYGFDSQKEDPEIKKHLKKFESLLEDLQKYMSKYDWD